MMANKLTKEMFQEVIAFFVSEWGAMGPNGTMGFYTRSGEYFQVNYLSEETPYQKVKEYFPALQGCCWNGPMKTDRAFPFTIVIGDDAGESTRIPDGYRHIYLDYGNHLCVREELFSYVKNLFQDKKNIDLTFGWQDILAEAKIEEKVEDITAAYRKQKEEDEKFAKVLAELNQNPEYRRRILENKDGIEGMLAVLKEFSGIEMDFLELKQFGLRQQGIL